MGKVEKREDKREGVLKVIRDEILESVVLGVAWRVLIFIPRMIIRLIQSLY